MSSTSTIPARRAANDNAATTDLAQLAARIDALADAVEGLTAVVERLAAHQPLVDLQTAAEHMGVSKRTLRRLVAQERVAYRRVGRSLRFNLSLLAPRAGASASAVASSAVPARASSRPR